MQNTSVVFRPVRSDGELFTTPTTTGSQNSAAVLGGHTGTETVNLIALTFLRLISVLHNLFSPLMVNTLRYRILSVPVHRTAIIVYPLGS